MSQLESVPGAVPEFTLGDRMKKALNHSGVSVSEMADYLGIERTTCARWFSGKRVRRSYLILWAMRTGVSLEWLETGKAPQPKLEGHPYAIRDSNPEPADMRPAAWQVAA